VPITLRELEVADLVAEGLSNPAIAAALCVSRRTVAAHLTHIMTKLDFSNRVQVAVWAATRQRTSP
jgi:DNA-binding NarL/FixJ family response regulator